MCSQQPHRPDPTDVLLVAQARGGDARAFAALFRRYQPPIVRFFARRLDGEDAAREAAQETLARAFVRLDTLRCPAQVRSWLFAFARHVLYEMRRVRVPEPLDGLDDGDAPAGGLAGATPDGAGSPEAHLIRRELAGALDAALATLPAPRRSALLLRAVDEADYGAIGARLGWPRGKVKNEIHRARVALRRRLYA
jgi:RNA polymerase sigma-70 factor (ECF subfamily)